MADVARLMALGMHAELAKEIAEPPSATTINGAGASAGNATAVTTAFTYVGTAAANTGVILKPAGNQPVTVVYNGGINTVKVYPATGEKINNGAANAAFSLTAAKSLILVGTEGAWIANMSA